MISATFLFGNKPSIILFFNKVEGLTGIKFIRLNGDLESYEVERIDYVNKNECFVRCRPKMSFSVYSIGQNDVNETKGIQNIRKWDVSNGKINMVLNKTKKINDE